MNGVHWKSNLTWWSFNIMRWIFTACCSTAMAKVMFLLCVSVHRGGTCSSEFCHQMSHWPGWGRGVPVVQNFATRCPTDLVGGFQNYLFPVSLPVPLPWGVPPKKISIFFSLVSLLVPLLMEVGGGGPKIFFFQKNYFFKFFFFEFIICFSNFFSNFFSDMTRQGCGWYASCSHAGGLSCWGDFL